MYNYDTLLSENQRLHREVQRHVNHFAAINEVVASISQSPDLNLTLDTALRAVLSITEAEAGGISLIDAETGDVVLRAQLGWIHDFVTQNPMRIPRGQGMSGHVIRQDAVLVENNLDGTQKLAVPKFHDEEFRSIVMAPMHARGRIIGILSIMSYQPNRFDQPAISVLRVIADTVGLAVENARLYEKSLEHDKQVGAILESTADGILATDCTGRIQLINQAAASILDLDPDQVIGEHLRSAPILPRIRESLLFLLASHSDSSRSFLATLENQRALSVLVSEIRVESQIDQTRDTEGWVVVLQDVTHFQEAEMARTRFIQAAAHDMRNPLGTAISSLEVLERHVAHDPALLPIVDIAVSSVERLQGLIDDLFNLEHIQSGYGFNLEDVDMGEMIYEISAGFKPQMAAHDLHFSVEMERGITPLRLDRRWVTRAICNYLDNAIKYTPPGSDVVLRIFTDNDRIHVEVADDGPGIPVEAQPRLYERFYRAADASIPGTGLGLAIVKSVAEAHGGGVYLNSTTGQGSVFGFTLLRTV